MEEAIGGGHCYTAEEVRLRLERAKQDGALYRDHRGVYHANVGHSGVSGYPGYPGSPGFSGSVRPIENITYDSDMIRPRARFSIRALIREAVRELKAYFTKKEK